MSRWISRSVTSSASGCWLMFGRNVSANQRMTTRVVSTPTVLIVWFTTSVIRPVVRPVTAAVTSHFNFGSIQTLSLWRQVAVDGASRHSLTYQRSVTNRLIVLNILHHLLYCIFEKLGNECVVTLQRRFGTNSALIPAWTDNFLIWTVFFVYLTNIPVWFGLLGDI